MYTLVLSVVLTRLIRSFIRRNKPTTFLKEMKDFMEHLMASFIIYGVLVCLFASISAITSY